MTVAMATECSKKSAFLDIFLQYQYVKKRYFLTLEKI